MEFAFLDIEATGSNPYRARIVEIAIIITGEGLGERDRFSTLVRPEVPIDRKSHSIHGISEKELVDAPSFQEVAGKVRELLSGKVVIGYRIGDFDLRLLNMELARTGNLTIFPRYLDLKDLEQIPRRKSLYHMARSMSIPAGRLHRAMPDVRTTLKIIREVVRKYGLQAIIPAIRNPVSHPKLSVLAENTNMGFLSHFLYRSRFRISEHVGFPLIMDTNRVLFRNTYINRNFRLHASKIINIERVR